MGRCLGVTHHIVWDHSDCEHDPDPSEHYCSPADAIVTCDDQACPYRLSPDDPDPYSDDDFWFMCRGRCLEDEFGCEHADPGVPHTTRGYTLVAGGCNAADWVSSDDLRWEFAEFRDGAIAIEWDGGAGQYSFTYLDPPPRDAVG